METDEPLNTFYISQTQSQERMFFIDDYIFDQDINLGDAGQCIIVGNPIQKFVVLDKQSNRYYAARLMKWAFLNTMACPTNNYRTSL